MRPSVTTKAHKTDQFAELVCSNSFRGAALSNAVGLLKAELEVANSLVMKAARACQLPAGGALAVDRHRFSQYITDTLRAHPLLTFKESHVEILPDIRPLIVATGPLTSPPLARAIETLVGSSHLAFFDAISPILFRESINFEVIFRQSRYDKGDSDDYLNIPMSQEQYERFIDLIEHAEKYTGNEEVENDSLEKLRPFEGCMPIEDMVERGKDTARFGPLKPVGLTNPHTGQQPYAVLQLRQEDREGSMWSMVGMQTRMKRADQDRVFRDLPGLENAEFVRYGSVHRNTFIDSPRCLEPTLQFRDDTDLFFAGQLTGVEGYVESTAGGLVAGFNAARICQELPPLAFPTETAIGSLMSYVSNPHCKNFQPMNVSFGLLSNYQTFPRKDPLGKRYSKSARREAIAGYALDQLSKFLTQ